MIPTIRFCAATMFLTSLLLATTATASQPTTYVILDFPWPDEDAPAEQTWVVEMSPDITGTTQATTYTILDFTWPEDEMIGDGYLVFQLSGLTEDTPVADLYLDDVIVGTAEVVTRDEKEPVPDQCSSIFADSEAPAPVNCMNLLLDYRSEEKQSAAVQCVSVFASPGDPAVKCMDIFLDYDGGTCQPIFLDYHADGGKPCQPIFL